jgi:cell fate regulator YaaT (PSP1 superfamily)
MSQPGQQPQRAQRGGRREVRVQFRTAGRIYRFDPGQLELTAADQVVVETDRGMALGSVVAPPAPRHGTKGDPLPRVVKKADDRDLARDDTNKQREREAHHLCLEQVRARGLPIKLIKTDYVFDGVKATFYYGAGDSVDCRDLARKLAEQLNVRVEMKQMGARDETKVTGAMGPCGRELCCSSWLREFAAISVRMAKEQDLALNHTRLAGMCGRLKCCLRYEYDTYVSLRRGLPRVGKTVESVKGEGQVVRQNILKQTVVLRTADGIEVEATLEDLVAKRSGAEGTA